MRPGEQRSPEELREMVGDLLLAASAAALPSTAAASAAAPPRSRPLPKRMAAYHGTGAPEFEAFDQAKTDASPRGSSSALGVFFSPDIAEAATYAEGYAKPGRVVKASIPLKNPKVIEKYSPEWDQMLGSRASAARLRDDLLRQGFDSVVSPMGPNGELIALRPEQIRILSQNARPR
jgi:hypothetical protein